MKRLKRNHDSAVILGCGPSINEITDEVESELKNHDTWAINNFMVHKTIIPNFYHLEVKKHRNLKMATDIIKSKKEEYKVIDWVLDESRPYLFDIVRPEWFPKIHRYRKRYEPVDSGKYKPEGNPRVSCGASMSLILDMAARLGYSAMYFIGVDFYSSEYFWTQNHEYDDIDTPDIMKSCKPDERPKGSQHPTVKMAKFIEGFGEFNGIEMINLSEGSLLRGVIKTMSLSDFTS